MDDTQRPGALAAAHDPNRQSTLRSCPTCMQRRPQRKPDGWGQMMDWWDCWPCFICGVMVCNRPGFPSNADSCTCSVQHNAAVHPELYDGAHSDETPRSP